MLNIMNVDTSLTIKQVLQDKKLLMACREQELAVVFVIGLNRKYSHF